MSDQLWPRLHHKHRESAMAEQNANHSDSLHPLVNMSIIGFVLMFVAAMWMFFDSDPYQQPAMPVIGG
jgi:hypothetical protein